MEAFLQCMFLRCSEHIFTPLTARGWPVTSDVRLKQAQLPENRNSGAPTPDAPPLLVNRTPGTLLTEFLMGQSDKYWTSIQRRVLKP